MKWGLELTSLRVLHTESRTVLSLNHYTKWPIMKSSSIIFIYIYSAYTYAPSTAKQPGSLSSLTSTWTNRRWASCQSLRKADWTEKRFADFRLCSNRTFPTWIRLCKLPTTIWRRPVRTRKLALHRMGRLKDLLLSRGMTKRAPAKGVLTVCTAKLLLAAA